MHALLSGRSGRIAAQAAVLTAVIGSSVAYAAINKTITLNVDGRTSEVHALSGDVAGLLKDQGIKVGPRDLVAPAPSSGLHDGQTVVVRFARQLTVTIDGQQRTYWTTELSVERALAAIGIHTEGARLSASRSQRIGRNGLALWLLTPKDVIIIADGRRRDVVSAAPTVGDLLREQGLELNPLDRLSTLAAAPVTDGLLVRIVRVVQKRATVTEDVAFDVERRKTADLYEGEKKIATPGRKGSRSAVYDLVVTDGKVTKRTLVTARQLTAPVTQVVLVGTKEKPSSGGGGSVGGSVDSLNWAALAECESGGNPRAVNPAGYYGLYQFSLATWHSVGGSGNPIDNSSAEQTYRAKLLYKRTGASSWPSCGPRLFT